MDEQRKHSNSDVLHDIEDDELDTHRSESQPGYIKVNQAYKASVNFSEMRAVKRQESPKRANVDEKQKTFIDNWNANLTFLSNHSRVMDLLLEVPSQNSNNDMIKCEIVRVKHKLPEFKFYIERPNNPNEHLKFSNDQYKLVMKSKFQIKPMCFNNLIESIDGGETKYIGKVKANLLRDKMSLHYEEDVNNIEKNKEFCQLNFDYSLKRYGKPTVLTARVPYDNRAILELHTREPVFNPIHKDYRLNFFGRALKSSANNIQLADLQKPDNVIFLLGKYDDDVYKCDFTYPLNAFQAFGIALAVLSKRDLI